MDDVPVGHNKASLIHNVFVNPRLVLEVTVVLSNFSRPTIRLGGRVC